MANPVDAGYFDVNLYTTTIRIEYAGQETDRILYVLKNVPEYDAIYS